MKKALTDVTIKNADLGLVEAVFSRFDVIDKDGDVTRKGAFREGAAVVISAYGHKSWEGQLPIGKGTIHELDDVAVLKGQFFMNTTHGRDAFETVKELSEAGLQEWSYSLHDVVAKADTVEGRKVRVLEKIGVKEVSPVLIGAGVDTRTLSTKGVKQWASATRQALQAAARERWADEDVWVYVDDYDPEALTAIVSIEADTYRLIQVSYSLDGDSVTFGDDEIEVVRTVAYARKGSKFSEQTDAALVAVKQLVHMAAERLALRAPEGKPVTEQLDAYEQLMNELSPLKSAIDATNTPTPDDELAREFARFVAISQGVTS
jgi:hypothetical protein